MLGWHRENPRGFFIIRAINGERVGNWDILPLRPETLEAFRNGDIIERDMRGEHRPYGYAEVSQLQEVDLYIESFVCKSPLAVAVVLSQFQTLVQRICDPRRVRNIFAIAASDDGINLLKDLGFRVVGRAQRHDLYACSFSDLSKEIGAVATAFLQLFEGRLQRLEASGKPTGL